MLPQEANIYTSWQNDVIEDLCAALARTNLICEERMLSAQLKNSPITKQIEKNEQIISHATDLVCLSS